MPYVKKIKKDQVKSEAVLNLVTEAQGYEIAVGSNYYELYPLSADNYVRLMGIFRKIWYGLVAEKESQYKDSIDAAKALASNMGELDDDEVRQSVHELMTSLSESRDIHALEFLSHSDFTKEINELTGLLLEGCDEEDRDNLTIEQMARLFEVCFIQNFLPFIRLATTADRVFRESS